jgi:hypothetical protein
MKCEYCNNDHNGNYGSGRFCNVRCARGFSSREKRQEINRRVSEKLKGNIPWNKGTGKPKPKPSRYIKKDNIKICRWCGQGECKRKDICKKYQIFPSLIKYFGMNPEVIGMMDLYKEYERIIEIVKNLYYDKEMSLPQLAEYFNYTNDIRNFNKILNSIEIEKRTRSNSLINAYKNGRCELPKSLNNSYKCGYYTTWEGKKVFLRSSYEFDYAEHLDKERIRYNVENLRFQYWDSQLLKNRIAIPDFHIIDFNIIVEIKSDYTLNLINMKDKKMCYENAGYELVLIVEREEMSL